MIEKTGQREPLAPGAEARRHFPIFSGARDGRTLSYLDTAASSQKPDVVINRLCTYLSEEHANVHRGTYQLSARATELYEQCRARAARFLNAESPSEIIFTRGTTEAINLLSYSLGAGIQQGSVVMTSVIDHHSNMVPWQLLAARNGAEMEYFRVTPDVEVDLVDYREKLDRCRPAIVAFPYVSNAFGTVFPVAEMTALAHAHGALVVVDAAQAAAHRKIDVRDLDVDFLALSGHKMYGPTGIGILYGRRALLEQMPPFQGGGEMIETVTLTGPTFAEPPHRFEAGTPAIAEAIALEPAFDFISDIGFNELHRHERELFEYALRRLREIEGLTIYGPVNSGGEQETVLAFNVAGIHPHDLSTIVDDVNVQIRAGNHCVMPGLNFLGLQSTARASIGVYTVKEDFDALVEGIVRAKKLLL